MKFEKVTVTEENNWLKYKIIEFLELNYDGRGGALALCDGKMEFLSIDIVNWIVLGVDAYGDENEPCYKLVRDKE